MISFKPSRQGSAHVVLPLTLILCGLTALLGAAYQTAFAPAILQAVGFLLLGSSIPVLNRYTLATFLYTVGEETPDLLCVRRIMGKSRTTPVTADLNTAVGVRILTPEDHARPSGARRVNMCLNMFPKKRMAITFLQDGVTTELVLETDDEFYSEIEDMINKIRNK